MTTKPARVKLNPEDYRVRVSELARRRYGDDVIVSFLPGVPVTVAITDPDRLLGAGQGIRDALRRADGAA